MPWFPFKRRISRRDRADEMQAHLDMYADQLVASGSSPDAARREARLRFGNPGAKLEAADALNRPAWLDTLRHDIRSAVRGLRRAPRLCLVVGLILTLAMAATTAMFSVADASALRGLPFDHDDRLVAIEQPAGFQSLVFAAPDYLAMRDQQEAVFAGLAAVTDTRLIVRNDGGPPEILNGERVTADFFAVLRVVPAIGAPFTRENEIEGRDRVAVISNGLWRRRFGGAPDILGRRLAEKQGDLLIIGVMPSGFSYPVGALEPTDVWVPYVVPVRERVARVAAYLRLIARLKDGLAIDEAQTRLRTLASRGLAGHSGVNPKGEEVHLPDTQIVLRSLHESLTRFARPWMRLLLAAVGCVLLVACVNIANLLLIRATVRSRELGVRVALGATRWDLARMLLWEGVLLSMVSACFGTLAAWAFIAIARPFLPEDLPRVAEVALSLRAVTVTGIAALITSVIFGLAPMLYVTRAIDPVLRESSRTGTSSRRQLWLRSGFLVAEVTLAVVLLVGAGLFLASFSRLAAVDLGVDPRHVLTVDVRPDNAEPGRLAGLIDEVKAMPGIEAVAIASANVPFSLSTMSRPIEIPNTTVAHAVQTLNVTDVSTDYLRVLGLTVLAGRAFTREDSEGGAPVVILNATAARTYLPDGDAIGRVVAIGRQPRTVIGIVNDVRLEGPERDIPRQAFLPAQSNRIGDGTLLIKTARNTTGIVGAVRAAIAARYPDLAVPPARSLDHNLGRLVAQRRFVMILLVLFGVLGLVIGAIGIYAAMAFVVTERTREIGIRMAMGAQPWTVLRSILRRAGAHVAVGLACGLSLSWFLATSIDRFLFHVQPHDLIVFGSVCALTALTSAFASLLPARRAAAINPLLVLRLE